MKDKTTINQNKDTDSQRVKKSSHLKSSLVKKTEINPVRAELVGEGHEDFYNYLDWLGLAKSPDLLILASTHHYYFEADDLKDVRIVVSLKKLNSINRPKDFLQEIFSILPHKCYFIGSFTDNKKQNVFTPSKKIPSPMESEEDDSELAIGRWNSFLNVLYGVIDAKTIRFMTERTVRQMLESIGLKILDITEFNGLTYFCTQKDNSSVE